MQCMTWHVKYVFSPLGLNDVGYEGVVVTLIDALDALAIMGNNTDFSRMVRGVFCLKK